MFRKLLNDEAGFIISAELMLVLTLGFTAAAVGAAAIRDALVQELNDVSHMIGAVSQEYNVAGVQKVRNDAATGGERFHGRANGFGFDDDGDDCDCNAIAYTDTDGKDDPSTGDENEGNP